MARVLVVDDDLTVREVVASYLRAAGHDVVEAGDGEQALELVQRAPADGPVDLVVLGSLTLLAIPVLGRFGARSDNPTLLDRPYGWSWLALAVVTVALVALAGVIGSRRARAARPGASDEPAAGGDGGPGAGGR